MNLYPFTAPAITPPIICFCITKYNTRIGIMARTKAANAIFNLMLYCPKKKYWVSGIVLTSGFWAIINGIWNSFQTDNAFKIKVDDTIGFISGNTIFQNV